MIEKIRRAYRHGVSELEPIGVYFNPGAHKIANEWVARKSVFEKVLLPVALWVSVWARDGGVGKLGGVKCSACHSVKVRADAGAAARTRSPAESIWKARRMKGA